MIKTHIKKSNNYSKCEFWSNTNILTKITAYLQYIYFSWKIKGDNKECITILTKGANLQEILYKSDILFL